MRTVEIEPSLYAADFARLGEQIEVLLRDGRARLPLRRRRRPLRRADHDRPDRAAGDRADRARDRRRRDRLPSDGRQPDAATSRRSRSAGGDSVTFHYEVVDDVPATIAAAREHGLQVGVAFNPETEPEDVAKVAGDADLVLCMSIHPGYSGQEFMPEALERIARTARGAARVGARPGRRRHRQRQRPRGVRGRRDADRRGQRDLRARGPAARVPPPRPSSGVNHSSGRSSSQSAAAERSTTIRSSARSSSPAARSSARAGTSTTRSTTRRRSRSRRRASARAARRST